MFKTRKKSKIKVLFIYFFIGIISYYLTYNYLSVTNDLVLNKESFLINIGLNKFKNTFYKTSKIKSILYMGLNYNLDDDTIKVLPSIKGANNPKIYIYNTHQSETYDTKLFNAYNISYTVETASYLLKDNLSKYGIDSLVEDESISSYLNINNLSYKDSYKASRNFIIEKLNNYPSIEYIIDIHRDSLPKEKTTVSYDNKDYAKVLFVVGGNNPNYLKNYELANKINSKLTKEITSGIIIKKGNKVNGVYNQDISNNAILIEIGGIDNTIIEVNNTTIILAKAIYESMGDKNV